MTRRKPRINSVEEADKAMERLGWLRAQATPNAAVRELWDCAVAYRAAVHRQQPGEKKPGWAERVTK
ncbi:hypothetical protein J8F10_09225 [Gemmata sp. G18]|uniref:Uncharacterized protein n=1 Tax=Gemmata palustris TaxID=2822762 RepID=A0ABS5BP09_9BACT|nr:hypothetical protein [Gemmata palustris]MBP3955462.1 hypothetical protein [Gemmata palustris]